MDIEYVKWTYLFISLCFNVVTLFCLLSPDIAYRIHKSNIKIIQKRKIEKDRECSHDFGKWSYTSAMKIFQIRTCKNCGYSQQERYEG